MYLIDTNVLSEVIRKAPNKSVLEWYKEINDDLLFISCVSIAEIQSRIILKEKTDKKSSLRFKSWLEELISNYSDRIIGVNLATSMIWGEIMHKSNDARDSLIAAQAIQQNMTVVTRNINFERVGVKIINPFEE